MVTIAAANPDAITTALIALGGAIVGATASSATQILVHWLQGRREDDARKREFRTAARVMQVDLARAWSNIEYAARTGRWWPKGRLESRLTDADRRQVIGGLTAKDLYTVDGALVDIESWYSNRDQFDEVVGGDLMRPVYDPDDLKATLGRITAAGATLREITGDPDSIEPEKIEDERSEPASGESSNSP